MRLIIHRLALREMVTIAAKYDRKRDGLGGRFLAQVEAAFARIREHPLSGQPLVRGERQMLLQRFPHKVIYFPAPDRTYVAAVAHPRRREGYWRRRRFEN